MLPQDFTQSLDETARTAPAYPHMMQSFVPQRLARPQLGHMGFIQNPGAAVHGQQFMVMPSTQHILQQPMQIMPQMSMEGACAPKILDKPLSTLSSAELVMAPTVCGPAVYSAVTLGSSSRQPYGNMWAPLPGAGRLDHMTGAVVGQATSVEDILQLLRSMPRGTSSISVVADSLRFLDSRALAALLKELSKTGLREVAFEIFDWLRTLDGQLHPEYVGLLDVFTYTTMIARCTNHMHLPTALALVSEMRTRNIPLNAHTYSSWLNVCVKAGELELALDVFRQMLNEGLQPNLVTFNTLLEVYAKRGMWCDAVGVLDTLEQQRLLPEPRTFNIVMNACNAAAQYSSCIAVHSRMASQKVPPTVGTYNAVILAHCKRDQLSTAQQLFDEMRQQGCQPTHTTFITLLQSAEQHGQAQIAVKLLEQMQAMSLRLTPQCYAAAIGACAAAGQLVAARKLLAEMLASSKAGMAAPAHIIMQLQDKCCDWQGAYRTYLKLLASGVRPDSQTTATAIEALWGAGNVSSCLLALQVFEGACQQGVFRLNVSVQAADTAVEFSLPVAGACMALIGLWRLLAELKGRVARDGAKILRDSVVVLLGDGQAVVPQLYPAMVQWCAVPGVPFIVDANSTKQVKLTGQAPKVAQWLLSSLLMCPVMPAASELEGLQETLMQEAETATLGNCRQQLLEATEMERSLMQNADTLPVQYSQTRASLWQLLQAACANLQPQSPQLPHTAFVLLDQAAAAGLWQAGDTPDSIKNIPHAWLLAACVVLASQAAAARVPAVSGATASFASAVLSEADVARQFKVDVDEVLLGVGRVRERCSAACRGPVVSAYTFIEVYLEALLAGQLDRKVPAASLVGEALALAGHASSCLSSLGLPASQLAAVLVIAGRQSRGLHPVWPKALVVLTGMLTPVSTAQQHLLQELMAKAATLRHY